jgi:hypothetical protein
MFLIIQGYTVLQKCALAAQNTLTGSGLRTHVLDDYYWGFSAGSTKPEAGGPLIGCPRVSIRYIRNYPPYPEAVFSLYEFSGSNGGEYEDGCLLGYCFMWFGRSLPKFQRCLLLPSSGRWVLISLMMEAASNVGKLLPRYTVQQHRRPPFSSFLFVYNPHYTNPNARQVLVWDPRSVLFE